MKFHIDGQDLCLRLLTDRYYSSLSIVNLWEGYLLSDQICQEAAAACLYPLLI